MGIPAKDGGIAFAHTCGAGLATTVGAAIVFFPRLVHYANNKVLASSLSVAAGVMIYVSFVEIFVKSKSGFEDAGHSEGIANLLATVCFFGGIASGQLLNRLSHLVSGEEHDPECDHHSVNLDELRRMMESAQRDDNVVSIDEATKTAFALQQQKPVGVEEEETSPSGKPPAHLPSGEVAATEVRGCTHSEDVLDPHGMPHSLELEGSDKVDKDKKLVKMGMQTALAIMIHNFPEGLATFVATLDDPVVGAGLAIAIAVHNVPEGLCVSVPIYYATHDRWEAFRWAFISGISEPIGAGLGWLVLYKTMDDNAYGIVFGLVAGMMVNICVSELLPTSFKYDPKDLVMTKSFVTGMAIMALSLVLFVTV